MEYEALSTLYYGDKKTYQNEYWARFNSPETIKLNFKIKDNQAFFVQHTAIFGLVTKILRADKEVSILRGKLPLIAIDQFTDRCLIDEIVLTNKIEGVYSTRKEIASVLKGLENVVEKKSHRKRFSGLVAKYYKLKEQEHIELKTCEDVRALYNELVLPEVIEENPNNAPDGRIFRKDSASVNSATDKEIHRGTYPESEICREIEQALAFLGDKTIEPLYRVAIFHYLLEYIHPFYDGNGRLGRFIISDLLAQNLDPLLAYRISYTITENISRYYTAFKVCNDEHNLGDITPFLLMMLDMINISVSQLKNALETRIAKFSHYSDNISKLPYADKQKTHDLYYRLIQAALFAEQGITMSVLKILLRQSSVTIKNTLNKVEDADYLNTIKVGKTFHYSLNLERFDALLAE